MNGNLLEYSIHTLNTSTHVYFDMIKYLLEEDELLNEKGTVSIAYTELRKEFIRLNHILKEKDIEYSKLKTALIPTEKKKKEVVFIFDATKLSETNFFYGEKPYLNILSKLSSAVKSSFIIYKGDLLIKNEEFRKKVINHINKTENINNNLEESGRDYYCIYIKGLGDDLLNKIIDVINKESLFYNGHIVCNNEFIIKSLLSSTLIQEALIHKKNVILSNSDDNSDINTSLFDYSSFGYRVVGIHSFYYSCFLTYKIESIIFDLEEVNNAINLTQSKEIDISTFDLEFDEEKHKYITENKNLKSKGDNKRNEKIYSSNLNLLSFKEFYELLEETLKKGDIFNIVLTPYGIKFNKKIYVKNRENIYYSFLIAFQIKERERKIHVVTMM